MVLLHHILLLESNPLDIGDDALLNLKIDFEFDVLELKDVVLYDDLEKVTVLLCPDAPIHLLTDFFS